MDKKKVVVVGAGIAGIATAIRLAIKGFEVEVHEKNSVAGGKMYLIEKGGYKFDAGPSLFTQPVNLEELFQLAGEDISTYFQYSSLPLACRYFFENGKLVNAYTDRNAFATEMETQLNEPSSNVQRYLRNAERVYEDVGQIFLNYSLHKAATWLHPRVIKALKTVRLPYLFSTLHQFNQKEFSTSEAVQIFNRFATYNGSNPYSAPGMLSLIPHLEQNQGTFYPMGGMISIPNALIALAKKKGVRFVLNSEVKEIVVKQKVVKGIQTAQGFIAADVVVSNMDSYFTYQNLLNNQTAAKKVLKNERSSSAYIFYWGVNKSFPELHLHNIFFSKNYQDEFDHLFVKKRFYHDPSIYINITSKMEDGHAPEQAENWFVMVNAPANTEMDWEEQRVQLKAQIIKKLNRMLSTDLDQLIEVEEVLSPLDIERQTASYKGSLYGTSSNSKWAAFLRQANFSSSVKG
ncbi:MAG: phytoene desaturase, partial [Bacteroidota bacterium]